MLKNNAIKDIVGIGSELNIKVLKKYLSFFKPILRLSEFIYFC